MDFQWAEFDENLMTNFINAAIALKEAGLKSADDWARLTDSQGILPQIYGNRSVTTAGGSYIKGNFPEIPREHTFG